MPIGDGDSDLLKPSPKHYRNYHQIQLTKPQPEHPQIGQLGLDWPSAELLTNGVQHITNFEIVYSCTNLKYSACCLDTQVPSYIHAYGNYDVFVN